MSFAMFIALIVLFLIATVLYVLGSFVVVNYMFRQMKRVQNEMLADLDKDFDERIDSALDLANDSDY